MPDDKTLSITNPTQAKEAGVEVHGDPGAWICVSKAWNGAEGWMKSTKVMELNQGCLVQVTTQQRNLGGNWVIAEALTYAPGVKLADFPKPEEPVEEKEEVEEKPKGKKAKRESYGIAE